jgi:glutamyl-Q tRNA(Asp) synthetase
LFAAVISYLDARSHHGEWLIRIEDIDPLREQPQAKQAILQTLSAHGLVSDKPVIFQSDRSKHYEDALASLAQAGFTYACPCSRKYLNEHQGIHQPICRDQNTANTECAIKFSANNKRYIWQDQFQGNQAEYLNEDFVLKRKEGFYAYQLAVVCDDIDQGITHVIRGYDLLDSTPMQLALYDAFKHTPPVYGHFPVITSATGQKLSKQNLASPVNNANALDNLLMVFAAANIKLSGNPATCEHALNEASLLWQPGFLSGKSELLQAGKL